jgi:hypothetical protein
MPSVDIMRAFEPLLSKNTPFGWNLVSSLQIENSVRSIISRSTALSTVAYVQRDSSKLQVAVRVDRVSGGPLGDGRSGVSQLCGKALRPVVLPREDPGCQCFGVAPRRLGRDRGTCCARDVIRAHLET